MGIVRESIDNRRIKNTGPKFKRFVLENIKWHTSGKQGPRYVVTYNARIYDGIVRRHTNIMFNKEDITEKTKGLYPLGTLPWAAPTTRTKTKPWFTEIEWRGKDKFGGNKARPQEVEEIQKYPMTQLSGFVS